jgi:hypothetical protein
LGTAAVATAAGHKKAMIEKQGCHAVNLTLNVFAVPYASLLILILGIPCPPKLNARKAKTVYFVVSLIVDPIVLSEASISCRGIFSIPLPFSFPAHHYYHEL